MGLTPSNLRLLVRLGSQLGWEGPLLSFGNQEVYATADDLRGLFAAEGVTPREPAAIRPHTSAAFTKHWPEKAKDFVHAQTFFEMLGVDGYTDLDKFDDDRPQILHDLNAPLPDDLAGRFGLVLDSGTFEHILDVRQSFESAIRAARVGGWVMHFNPASDVDHGFFSFSPTLYWDLYGVNGFEDAHCFIQVIDPTDFFAPSPTFRYRYGMSLTEVLDRPGIPLVCFAARKGREVERLAIPDQGLYDDSRGWPSGVERAADSGQVDGELL